jgi:hypothetical protein
MSYQTRSIVVNRRIATLSYFGGISLMLIPMRLRSRYAARHVTVAGGLQLIRFVWATLTIVVWNLSSNDQVAPHMNRLLVDMCMLLITGIPWPSGIDIRFALALSLPIGCTWILGLVGSYLAATGRTVDLEACFNADWSGEMIYPQEEYGDNQRQNAKHRAEDRSRFKEMTEQRLDRIWQASQLAAVERRRTERLEQVRVDQDAVLSRIANLNRMLSLGEISLTRFNSVYADLIDYLNVLRMELNDLEMRRMDAVDFKDQRPRPPTIDHVPDTRVLTLAIADTSGLPIRTYGEFPVDESLITGMVSAFESLSEEMFGSHVHKTQLADGQVVHFVRGRFTVAYAIFEDEPAPEQIFRLREFHESFEAINEDRLRYLPVDPTRLTDMPTPFDFVPREVAPSDEKPPAKPQPIRQIGGR